MGLLSKSEEKIFFVFFFPFLGDSNCYWNFAGYILVKQKYWKQENWNH